jgi:hypothetical protein
MEERKRWKRPRKRKGLGDRVEAFAQPIAKVIDALLGTDIRNCQACKRRRDDLNRF